MEISDVSSKKHYIKNQCDRLQNIEVYGFAVFTLYICAVSRFLTSKTKNSLFIIFLKANDNLL